MHIVLLKCPHVQIAFLKNSPAVTDLSRVYSNCCCSCSFEAEIIKIGQSSHKMYSNNSEFSRVYANFKCLYKKVWKLIECTVYFTGDVVTLWTFCWSLFALTNWSFVSDILNTAVLKGFYAHKNQFVLLSSIQCHFFSLVYQYAELSQTNFYWVLKPFLWFWCLSLPFTYFIVKHLLWQVTVIHLNDMTSPMKTTLHYHGFNIYIYIYI